jgi:uncharacterized repeat protein (TIGR01451 family)
VLGAISPTAIPGPDFTLDVDVAQDGRTLAYEIRFDNVGLGTARLVVLRDLLPEGATYLGEPSDVENGTWSRTYENLAPGAYNATVSVRLPASARDGDRVRNLVEIRYVGFAGPYMTKVYEQEFGVSLPVPTASTPAWVLAAPAGAGLAAVGGVLAYRRGRKPRLEQVFLMHNSGMLIHHWAANVSPTRDIDILSGMFVILKEFVRDSFREKPGGLRELQFGDSRVFLAEGAHAVLAAVVHGERVNGFPAQIEAAVKDFERLHGTTLEAWSGRLDTLPEAKAVVDRLVRGGYAHWRVAA